jgi:hypothetical protein
VNSESYAQHSVFSGMNMFEGWSNDYQGWVLVNSATGSVTEAGAYFEKLIPELFYSSFDCHDQSLLKYFAGTQDGSFFFPADGSIYRWDPERRQFDYFFHRILSAENEFFTDGEFRVAAVYEDQLFFFYMLKGNSDTRLAALDLNEFTMRYEGANLYLSSEGHEAQATLFSESSDEPDMVYAMTEANGQLYVLARHGANKAPGIYRINVP